MTEATPLILVGIATFRRNALLERCLGSLMAMDLPDVKVRVAIMDNSPDRMAEAVHARWQARSVVPLDYLSEPRQGITEARNGLLEHALSVRATYLAFIDDDETADQGWLCGLYDTLLSSGADVVQGAVRYVPEGATDGEATRITRHPERATVKSVGAGNVLFRTRLYEASGLRFDRRFSLTGGEDYDFFLRCAQAGAVMVWTNTAVVSESVPVHRQSRGYRLRRLFRTRATGAYSDRLRIGGWVVFGHLWRAFMSLIRAGLSLLFLPLAAFGGRRHFQRRAMRTAEHFAKGMGRIVGLLGLNIRMYK